MTIGRPLPTYTIVILDPEHDVVLAEGESGEIGIAGVGVAEGYLNRPELTGAKFIEDFLGSAPTIRRAESTARAISAASTRNGEIEYLGRIDTQIKLRGYRIELTEIELVLLEIPEIAQVGVSDLRARARRDGTRRLLFGQARRAGARPQRDRFIPAVPPAVLHDPGLSRAAAVDPDARQQQGRPQQAAEAQIARGCASAGADAPPEHADRGGALPRRFRRRWASTRFPSTAISSTNTARIRC